MEKDLGEDRRTAVDEDRQGRLEEMGPCRSKPGSGGESGQRESGREICGGELWVEGRSGRENVVSLDRRQG